MRRVSYEEGQIFAFTADLAPAASMEDGETIEVVCQDSCGGQIRTEADLLTQVNLDHVNGATGPIEVSGAEPGDALRVSILDIRVGKEGYVCIEPEFGVLRDRAPHARTRIVPIRNGVATFSEDVRIPVRPHIGTIGVATTGPSFTTLYPADHGGNLDTKEISKGNAVYLPVAQRGAMLALGDVHAIMGDGEVCGTGIEIVATVRLRTDVLRGLSLKRPLVETRTEWLALGSAPTLDEAAVLATSDGVDLLARGRGMTLEDADMLASLVCDLRISQDVDPNRTCKLAIPKAYLPSLPGVAPTARSSRRPRRASRRS